MYNSLSKCGKKAHWPLARTLKMSLHSTLTLAKKIYIYINHSHSTVIALSTIDHALWKRGVVGSCMLICRCTRAVFSYPKLIQKKHLLYFTDIHCFLIFFLPNKRQFHHCYNWYEYNHLPTIFQAVNRCYRGLFESPPGAPGKKKWLCDCRLR